MSRLSFRAPVLPGAASVAFAAFALAGLLLACPVSAGPSDAAAAAPAAGRDASAGGGHRAVGAVPSLQQALIGAAPDLDPEVLRLALEARSCALAAGRVREGRRLGVIDYSRPSTEPRLWVFDLASGRLLHREHVAHGRNTGENYARRFSNAEASYQSSLGLFATAETYVGGNGYSLRMDGLEAGVNDRARDRAIVMHGAPYVDPGQALRQGRLGRSLGCPALRPAVAREVIDDLREGQLLFAYYPDQDWLRGSPFFGCGALVAGMGSRE